MRRSGSPAVGARSDTTVTLALRDSLPVVVMKTEKSSVTASVVAGGKTKSGADIWYADLIEYAGARAHTITRKAKGAGALLFGANRFRRT